MVSGKGARLKGLNWERQVARDLREFDKTAKRNMEYQEGTGVDIETMLPYNFQCKSQKRVNWLAALGEVEAKHVNGVVAGKVTAKGEFAFMRWSLFLQLVHQAHTGV